MFNGLGGGAKWGTYHYCIVSLRKMHSKFQVSNFKTKIWTSTYGSSDTSMQLNLGKIELLCGYLWYKCLATVPSSGTNCHFNIDSFLKIHWKKLFHVMRWMYVFKSLRTTESKNFILGNTKKYHLSLLHKLNHCSLDHNTEEIFEESVKAFLGFVLFLTKDINVDTAMSDLRWPFPLI